MQSTPVLFVAMPNLSKIINKKSAPLFYVQFHLDKLESELGDNSVTALPAYRVRSHKLSMRLREQFIACLHEQNKSGFFEVPAFSSQSKQLKK